MIRGALGRDELPLALGRLASRGKRRNELAAGKGPLTEVESAAQVSLEAGNSPQMIFRHYRELVTEKEAGAWFGITPETATAVRERVEAKQAAKVVAFPARTAA